MVVNYKFILLFICLIFSEVGCAAESEESAIVEMATANYKNALADYEKQIRYCENKSKKNRIDRAIFKNIKLTQLQLQIAIGRFYYIELGKCEGEKFGTFLVNRGIYRETLKKFNAKFDSDNPIYYGDLELFGTRYHNFEIELKYLKYPESERIKLENMPELKQLFHLISAIDN